MNYNVFTDFHHAGLLQSLILLFEGRLGGKVYRPIGIDWHTKGYWKVYDHPATVQQYLGIGGATPDGTPKLNEVIKQEAFVYHCNDIDSGQTNRAITYEGFMQTPIDIVIASLPYHIAPFRKLVEEHPNHPKLIYQIGNAWTVEAGMAPNVMASARIDSVPPDVHFISYHQEFDTNIFKPSNVQHPEALFYDKVVDVAEVPGPKVFSFVNVFSGEPHFAHDWALFREVEQLMQGWMFKSFGGQCRNGAVGPSHVLAYKMREARFIWHTKAGGDGYGHVVHNIPAVARPAIIKREYYAGKLAEPLFIDGETCIAIDGISPTQIVDKINYYNEPDRYAALCKNAYNKFKEIVDFQKESMALQEFFTTLI